MESEPMLDKTERVWRWLEATPSCSCDFHQIEPWMTEEDDYFVTQNGQIISRIQTSSSTEEEKEERCNLPASDISSDEGFSDHSESVFDDATTIESDDPRKHSAIDDDNVSNDDFVFKKTIQGLEVQRVKWSTFGNDLLLRVENKLIPVHRKLLSTHSTHVRSKLIKQKDELILKVDGKLSSVIPILEILYGCGWNIHSGNLDDVIALCEHWKLEGILEKCGKYKNIENINDKQHRAKSNVTRTNSFQKLLGMLRL